MCCLRRKHFSCRFRNEPLFIEQLNLLASSLLSKSSCLYSSFFFLAKKISYFLNWLFSLSNYCHLDLDFCLFLWISCSIYTILPLTLKCDLSQSYSHDRQYSWSICFTKYFIPPPPPQPFCQTWKLWTSLRRQVHGPFHGELEPRGSELCWTYPEGWWLEVVSFVLSPLFWTILIVLFLMYVIFPHSFSAKELLNKNRLVL